MRYLEHPPPPALRERVACFWSITAPAGAPGHRVLPDGCVDILFDAAGPPVVVGAMTRAIVTDATTRPTEILGVRFRPGEAAAVLGVSLRELSNGRVDLADVWGERGRRVSDAVLERRTVDGRLGLLASAIEERLATRQSAEAGDVTTGRVRAAVRSILGAQRPPTVGALASSLGVTTRTLERALDERVGLRPKALVRVVRLQRVVAAMDRSAPTWTALAYDEGFSDQAHLVREVRELAGASPTALLRERLAMSDGCSSSPAGRWCSCSCSCRRCASCTGRSPSCPATQHGAGSCREGGMDHARSRKLDVSKCSLEFFALTRCVLPRLPRGEREIRDQLTRRRRSAPMSDSFNPARPVGATVPPSIAHRP